jgi:hypothetical protein
MEHIRDTSPTGREILDDAQTADYLQTTERTLRLWRTRLGLPHIRISNKTIRYRRADLDTWLSRRRVAIAA